ncbi:ABC transporter ATP-binding protein [Corynebacterium heidelbergense]|uniref:ABC transporter ATP-binding protein n=1 Tax=Corynebacterium heidelbergense TaxID=2055947 RepID=A0A364V862_9CORY|nr:ABC transporter ATP-binding protein [Corynebacterium heidelbergense]
MLEATALRRVFAGSPAPAVDGVSLSIRAGQIVGLVGPNGAGKTTTVRMCSTLLVPTSGALEICGVDALRRTRAARAHIGLVLGGESGFYQRASARDNLLFFADVLRVPTAERPARVDRALRQTGLLDRAHDRVGDYSRGMKQRLHIARGILNNPDVLLLDEPTNGLDPEISADIRALIRELTAGGMGILLTSHLLTEMEELSDVIHVIMGGTLRASGTAGDIARAAGVQKVTTFTTAIGTKTATANLLARLDKRADVARSSTVHLEARQVCSVSWSEPPGDPAGIVEQAGEQVGVRIKDLSTRQPNLEESYLALVGRR